MAPWRASDCILVWMYVQDLFGGFAAADVDGSTTPGFFQLDLGGAVMPDLGNGLFAHELRKDAKGPEVANLCGLDPAVKASHNFVIHGRRTASGKPIMLAKPQHIVMAPSFYYEYALKASHDDLDCRGAGLAGCPAFFHGWNRFAAWSLTSMPADQTDAYRVTFMNPAHTAYAVDGVPQAVSEYSETILVAGASSIPWKHRRTIWGPLTTTLDCSSGNCIPPSSATTEYALRSLVLDDAFLRHQHTITGALELMRCGSKSTLTAALRKWRTPSAHFLVATTAGDVGYRSLTGLPLRPAGQPMIGALDGNTLASDWPGEVAFTQLPAYFGDPFLQYGKSFLSTANNLACDPAVLPQPFVLGSAGDTDRAWRLREMLSARLAQPAAVTSAEVLAMDHDAVNPAIRTFVVLARAMRTHGDEYWHVTPRAQRIMDTIAGWSAPWKYDATVGRKTYACLRAIQQALDTFSYDPASGWEVLVEEYCSRHYGVLRMLRGVAGDEANFATHFPHPAELASWVADQLDIAGSSVTTPFAPSHITVPYQQNYLCLVADVPGFSNLPALNVELDGFTCPNTGTIWAQSNETYKFLANFDPAVYPDGNQAMLAPGVSEDWHDAALYLNHVDAWRTGTMYPDRVSCGRDTWCPSA